MPYVKTDDEKNILEYPYQIGKFQKDNPDISLPSEITDEFLAEFNIFKVEMFPLEPFNYTQYAKPLPLFFEDGVWKQTYEVFDKTEEQLANESNMRQKGLREKRNKFLIESDWVVAKAYELGVEVPQEWKEYRQALRDIPSQENFPFEVVFPQIPTV
jgi:hypothetical protein